MYFTLSTPDLGLATSQKLTTHMWLVAIVLGGAARDAGATVEGKAGEVSALR